LAALWRYDESLPEGMSNKGVLTTAGRKRRAERAKPINAAAKPVREPKNPKPPKPRKPRARKAKPEQTELAEVTQ
jgi:hypothetical protein